ncbi:winged helix family transcriptional regulator [Pseudomonas kairouanensis]|uniref:Winged helix family transcriptional regulator n=1 Tax=Pseudomonas kairouanensis TaxID=2293832 RepID=A0A4Z0AH30_9PSED|nr:helix-turn-helix domain-containing protein [Pseudomonas kairouanensis]TFY85643.1 winged helix family transcriptional regulator [Pseudomonas kairouanensis]
MSSLKKHAFTPTLPAIALKDFTPNTELFHYDPSAVTPLESLDNNLVLSHLRITADESKHIAKRLNTYVITHRFTLPSPLFHSARQESRAPAESDDNTHTRAQDINPDRTQLHAQDFWLLTQHDRTLVKGGLRISLTTIESALVKKMLHHEERVVSKEELIRNIGREPEQYRGLEMCLSRLQEKFKRANDGERLFRAVRNRGYCLTQKIKKPLELGQTRR